MGVPYPYPRRRVARSCIRAFGRDLRRLLGDGAGRDIKRISNIYKKSKVVTVHSLSYTGDRTGQRARRVTLLYERMVDMDRQRQQEAYKNYVKQKTPVHNLPVNMVRAFITGGVICTVGQYILNYCKAQGLDKDMSGAWTSLILILLSVLLTGFNIYPGIAKWGGAGALVPITGFANSVASPAIEYQKEGQVMGIGCKIFTIAGPVILYGVFSSWLLGLVYWLLKMSGIL